jgi:hypothetical protein
MEEEVPVPPPPIVVPLYGFAVMVPPEKEVPQVPPFIVPPEEEEVPAPLSQSHQKEGDALSWYRPW